MKKIIIFLVCAVLLICTARMVVLRFQDRPEDFAKVQEWIELGKESVMELEGAYDINAAGWFDDEGIVYKGNQERTKLSSGEVKHLSLQAAGCKVITEVTEETDFYFSFENMKKVQVLQEEDSLEIKVVRNTLFEKESENSLLKLYIPAECYLESARIELGAGSLEIRDFQTKTLVASVEAGKLMIDSLNAENVSISLGAGAVSLENAHIQNAKFSVDAGNMTVNGQISGDVDADCAVGNLQMTLQGTPKDFNYELQCVAGNVLLAGEKHSGINEGMLIDHAAAKSMELDCTVGNIEIEFE